MGDGERERLERELAGTMPGQLDLALAPAEALAALDPTRLSLLEDLGTRLEAATRRHRALEDAFGGRAIGTLAFALTAVETNPDRRSDDEALVVLAGAELERRRARQAELRATLAAVPRDQLDKALVVVRQLAELDPDGNDGLAASELLLTRSRLIDLHQQLTMALTDPLQPGVRDKLRELASAPRRLPDSPLVLERMAQAIAAARRKRSRKRLVIGASIAAALVVLAIATDVVMRQRRASTETATVSQSP